MPWPGAITGVPVLGTDLDDLAFGTVYVGYDKPLTLVVTNEGTDAEPDFKLLGMQDFTEVR